MKTVLNVKVDKEVKEQAKQAAADLGLPLSVIVNAELRKFAHDRIFTVRAPVRISKRLERSLAAFERDVRRGKNVSPAFSSARAAIKWLHKQ